MEMICGKCNESIVPVQLSYKSVIRIDAHAGKERS